MAPGLLYAMTAWKVRTWLHLGYVSMHAGDSSWYNNDDNNNNNNRIERRNLRFFTISLLHPNCLQHASSRGPGAIVCKSCATHTALITSIGLGGWVLRPGEESSLGSSLSGPEVHSPVCCPPGGSSRAVLGSQNHFGSRSFICLSRRLVHLCVS